MMLDKYSLGFSLSNLGPKSFLKLINEFGAAERAWNASEKEYERLGIVKIKYRKFDEFRRTYNSIQYTGWLKKEKVEFIGFGDKRYPTSLKNIENPPIGLFCKGNLTLLRHPGLDPGSSSLRIGVVGTRRITQYGRDVTSMLVTDLVKNGVVIVSGLALGVDGLAHHVALLNHGYAIAVLACGVDCCLPSENYNLYSQILQQNGLIISEYPLSQPPNKGTFLARNRIVAAISDGLLITEAAEGSGSLVTAEYSLQYGKKVFAVPGQITSRMSDGSLELLKKGATLVSNAEDILAKFEIRNSKSETNIKSQIKKLKLSKEEEKIVLLIENEGLTIDEIARESKLPISKIFILISNLELSGVVKNSGGKISIK